MDCSTQNANNNVMAQQGNGPPGDDLLRDIPTNAPTRDRWADAGGRAGFRVRIGRNRGSALVPEALRPRPAGDLPGDEEGAVAGALHAVAREGHVIP